VITTPDDTYLIEENRSKKGPLVNAMTVDVEDYFQVAAFEDQVSREEWCRYPIRVEESVDRIIALFDARKIKATFFVLGWVAERCPALIRRLVSEGHEIASHGMEHRKASTQTPNEFKKDVLETKALLEDTAGVELKGYRAASFSIGEGNLWALDVLEDTGHEYSSSIYPIRHDHYGMRNAPRFPFRLRKDGILEIPISTTIVGRRNIPAGGGGYFRLLPYSVSKWSIRRIHDRDKQSCVFYFHPWELDPKQPRISNIEMKSRFRHYVNLTSMENKLSRLLKDFSWDRIDRVYGIPRGTISL
jgi:polysaccharide deacetylase family protein (PEP-CTERM system associated)